MKKSSLDVAVQLNNLSESIVFSEEIKYLNPTPNWMTFGCKQITDNNRVGDVVKKLTSNMMKRCK
jgi:hypothetical protein